MAEGRGIALTEVLALVVCGVVLLPPLVPTLDAANELARRAHDRRQVGEIMTAMHQFAQQTNGVYPLPGELDLNNSTLDVHATQKNNTGNIFSILIFNGLLTPDQMVSPAEVNTKVLVDTGYEYDEPSRADDPENALWDPGFSGTPFDDGSLRRREWVGNQSYAHILPFGNRRSHWEVATNKLRPVIANRGPQYAQNDSAPYPAATVGRWTLVSGPLGVLSNTLRIHGPANTWEGHVAYNDLHVDFWTSPTTKPVSYSRAAGRPRVVIDNIFVNESDEPSPADSGSGVDYGRNSYLRPITRAFQSGNSVIVTRWRD
jgi:hypothetical protein